MTEFYYFALSFFVYGFLGWCTEVAYAAVKQGKFVNRGFLNGPICPVYGIGVGVVVQFLTPVENNLVLLYISSTILVTAIEGITGFLLEKIFHNKWWDYSDQPLNIGGYVRLYVWQEYTCNKRSNRQTADELIRMGITGNDLLTCDSAEKKSIGDYKSYGLLARAAEKGPGSREYSYKWLQSLREIIIDNVRCPVAAQEFMDYEYERDKEGNIITGYPDGNDHMIDAVRYATERIWKRRGE